MNKLNNFIVLVEKKRNEKPTAQNRQAEKTNNLLSTRIRRGYTRNVEKNVVEFSTTITSYSKANYAKYKSLSTGRANDPNIWLFFPFHPSLRLPTWLRKHKLEIIFTTMNTIWTNTIYCMDTTYILSMVDVYHIKKYCPHILFSILWLVISVDDIWLVSQWRENYVWQKKGFDREKCAGQRWKMRHDKLT